MFRRGLQVIKGNLGLYLWCNGVYYGLIIVCMMLVFLSPQIQESLVGEIAGQIQTGGTLLGTVGEAYTSGSVPLAAVITFTVNFFAGTILVLTIPSLIFPPLAAVMGSYRAVLWGIIFSPSLAEMRDPVLLLHSGTVLLEGQGYILAVFAGLVAFRGFLKPGLYKKMDRLAGYLRGWREAWTVYIWVSAVLAVAAVYEAITVIGLMQ